MERRKTMGAPKKAPKQKSAKKTGRVRQKKLLLILIVSVLVIAGGILFFRHVSAPSFKDGMAYLESRDQIDANAAAKQIRAEKRRKLVESIQSGERSVLAAFTDSVLLGDSRAQGFSEYGYLSDAQTLTSIGGKVYEISDYVEPIAQMKPDVIYIAYGVNDIESNVGNAIGEEGYGSVVAEQIRKLQEASPDSKIAVNSIIDVADWAQEGLLSHESVAQYNEQLKKMCQENGWIYVDNSDINPGDDFATDGIHFASSYYPQWAANMFYAVEEDGGKEQE